MEHADNQETNVSSDYFFHDVERPVTTTTHCSPEQRLRRRNVPNSQKVTLEKPNFGIFQELRNN